MEAAPFGPEALRLRACLRSNGGFQGRVQSVWKVPDAETKQLIERFFRSWLAGKPKTEAPGLAQRELIAELRESSDANRRQAPPLLWTGFICHGLPH